MSDENDEPIPGPLPSRSVQIAVEYLAELVAHDMSCKHGKTALYWNLIHTVMSHAGAKSTEAKDG